MLQRKLTVVQFLFLCVNDVATFKHLLKKLVVVFVSGAGDHGVHGQVEGCFVVLERTGGQYAVEDHLEDLTLILLIHLVRQVFLDDGWDEPAHCVRDDIRRGLLHQLRLANL